ncbi:MAG: hypothetical protein HYT80_05970 [Euryarchaeota archaeon]|nr:hypothetical protein [Euryarchaeota archaeon]
MAGLVVMMAGLWVFFDPGAVSPYCASEGDGCAYYQGGYSRGWAAGAQSMGAALTALGSALLGANWWLGKRDAAMP